jgi:hypothetical protein
MPATFCKCNGILRYCSYTTTRIKGLSPWCAVLYQEVTVVVGPAAPVTGVPVFEAVVEVLVGASEKDTNLAATPAEGARGCACTLNAKRTVISAVIVVLRGNIITS